MNRMSNETIDASIELFRNGDVIVTENGVTTEIPFDIPFEHDGFGQDEDWVRANFTRLQQVSPMLTAWWDGGVSPGEWTIDGGEHWLDYPGMPEWGYRPGWCCWLPTLRGSPNVGHLGIASRTR